MRIVPLRILGRQPLPPACFKKCDGIGIGLGLGLGQYAIEPLRLRGALHRFEQPCADATALIGSRAR